MLPGAVSDCSESDDSYEMPEYAELEGTAILFDRMFSFIVFKNVSLTSLALLDF